MRIIPLIAALGLSATITGCAGAGVEIASVSSDANAVPAADDSADIYGDYLSARFAADHHDLSEAAKFFRASLDFDPKDPQAQDKMRSGQYAGAVYEWQPGRGFAPLAGAANTGDNGVAISGDGRWLYFNWFFGGAVIRVARDGGSERATAALDFLPDNIHYAPDGSLYVTGQNVDPKQLLAGCPGGNCQHGTTIVKLDPATMKTRVIARLPPNAIFSDGTTALQIGDTIFLGSYRGDAVAYMKAPK